MVELSINSKIFYYNTSTGRIKLKKSIITDQFSQDFEESAKLAREFNFEFVEIHSLWNKNIEELTDSEIIDVKNILHKHNLKVSLLGTTLFLMCPLYTEVEKLIKLKDSFLVYSGTYEKHFKVLKRCIDICKEFDVKFIRLFPFRKEMGINKDLSEIIKDISVKFEKPIEEAEKEGISLILENCPHSYLPKGLMTFEVVKLLNSKNLGLLWDIGNTFRTLDSNIPEKYRNYDIFKEYEKIKEKIRYYHFKDYNEVNERFSHVTFGKGDIDYIGIQKSIINDKFEGYISLESEVEDFQNVIDSAKNFKTLGL